MKVKKKTIKRKSPRTSTTIDRNQGDKVFKAAKNELANEISASEIKTETSSEHNCKEKSQSIIAQRRNRLRDKSKKANINQNGNVKRLKSGRKPSERLKTKGIVKQAASSEGKNGVTSSLSPSRHKQIETNESDMANWKESNYSTVQQSHADYYISGDLTDFLPRRDFVKKPKVKPRYTDLDSAISEGESMDTTDNEAHSSISYSPINKKPSPNRFLNVSLKKIPLPSNTLCIDLSKTENLNLIKGVNKDLVASKYSPPSRRSVMQKVKAAEKNQGGSTPQLTRQNRNIYESDFLVQNSPVSTALMTQEEEVQTLHNKKFELILEKVCLDGSVISVPIQTTILLKSLLSPEDLSELPCDAENEPVIELTPSVPLDKTVTLCDKPSEDRPPDELITEEDLPQGKVVLSSRGVILKNRHHENIDSISDASASASKFSVNNNKFKEVSDNLENVEQIETISNESEVLSSDNGIVRLGENNQPKQISGKSDSTLEDSNNDKDSEITNTNTYSSINMSSVKENTKLETTVMTIDNSAVSVLNENSSEHDVDKSENNADSSNEQIINNFSKENVDHLVEPIAVKTDNGAESNTVTTGNILQPSAKMTDSVLKANTEKTDNVMMANIETVDCVLETVDCVLETDTEMTDSLFQPDLETVDSVLKPTIETVDNVLKPNIEMVDSVLKPNIETVDSILKPNIETADRILQPNIEMAENLSTPNTENVLKPSMEMADSVLPNTEKSKNVLKPSMEIADRVIKPYTEKSDNALKPSMTMADSVLKSDNALEPSVEMTESISKPNTEKSDNVLKPNTEKVHSVVKPHKCEEITAENLPESKNNSTFVLNSSINSKVNEISQDSLVTEGTNHSSSGNVWNREHFLNQEKDSSEKDSKGLLPGDRTGKCNHQIPVWDLHDYCKKCRQSDLLSWAQNCQKDGPNCDVCSEWTDAMWNQNAVKKRRKKKKRKRFQNFDQGEYETLPKLKRHSEKKHASHAEHHSPKHHHGDSFVSPRSSSRRSKVKTCSCCVPNMPVLKQYGYDEAEIFEDEVDDSEIKHHPKPKGRGHKKSLDEKPKHDTPRRRPGRPKGSKNKFKKIKISNQTTLGVEKPYKTVIDIKQTYACPKTIETNVSLLSSGSQNALLPSNVNTETTTKSQLHSLLTKPVPVTSEATPPFATQGSNSDTLLRHIPGQPMYSQAVRPSGVYNPHAQPTVLENMRPVQLRTPSPVPMGQQFQRMSQNNMYSGQTNPGTTYQGGGIAVPQSNSVFEMSVPQSQSRPAVQSPVSFGHQFQGGPPCNMQGFQSGVQVSQVGSTIQAPVPLSASMHMPYTSSMSSEVSMQGRNAQGNATPYVHSNSMTFMQQLEMDTVQGNTPHITNSVPISQGKPVPQAERLRGKQVPIPHSSLPVLLGKSVPHGEKVIPHGGKPISHGGKPLTHGGKPVPNGGKLAPHQGKLISHGGKPVPHGGKPVPHGGKSVPHGGKPVPHGRKPVPYGGKPLSSSGKPVSQGGNPIHHAGKPVPYRGKPAQGKPVPFLHGQTHHGKPVVSGRKSAVSGQDIDDSSFNIIDFVLSDGNTKANYRDIDRHARQSLSINVENQKRFLHQSQSTGSPFASPTESRTTMSSVSSLPSPGQFSPEMDKPKQAKARTKADILARLKWKKTARKSLSEEGQSPSSIISSGSPRTSPELQQVPAKVVPAYGPSACVPSPKLGKTVFKTRKPVLVLKDVLKSRSLSPESKKYVGIVISSLENETPHKEKSDKYLQQKENKVTNLEKESEVDTVINSEKESEVNKVVNLEKESEVNKVINSEKESEVNKVINSEKESEINKVANVEKESEINNEVINLEEESEISDKVTNLEKEMPEPKKKPLNYEGRILHERVNSSDEDEDLDDSDDNDSEIPFNKQGSISPSVSDRSSKSPALSAQSNKSERQEPEKQEITVTDSEDKATDDDQMEPEIPLDLEPDKSDDEPDYDEWIRASMLDSTAEEHNVFLDDDDETENKSDDSIDESSENKLLSLDLKETADEKEKLEMLDMKNSHDTSVVEHAKVDAADESEINISSDADGFSSQQESEVEFDLQKLVAEKQQRKDDAEVVLNKSDEIEESTAENMEDTVSDTEVNQIEQIMKDGQSVKKSNLNDLDTKEVTKNDASMHIHVPENESGDESVAKTEYNLMENENMKLSVHQQNECPNEHENEMKIDNDRKAPVSVKNNEISVEETILTKDVDCPAVVLDKTECASGSVVVISNKASDKKPHISEEISEIDTAQTDPDKQLSSDGVLKDENEHSNDVRKDKKPNSNDVHKDEKEQSVSKVINGAVVNHPIDFSDGVGCENQPVELSDVTCGENRPVELSVVTSSGDQPVELSVATSSVDRHLVKEVSLELSTTKGNDNTEEEKVLPSDNTKSVEYVDSDNDPRINQTNKCNTSALLLDSDIGKSSKNEVISDEINQNNQNNESHAIHKESVNKISEIISSLDNDGNVSSSFLDNVKIIENTSLQDKVDSSSIELKNTVELKNKVVDGSNEKIKQSESENVDNVITESSIPVVKTIALKKTEIADINQPENTEVTVSEIMLPQSDSKNDDPKSKINVPDVSTSEKNVAMKCASTTTEDYNVKPGYVNKQGVTSRTQSSKQNVIVSPKDKKKLKLKRDSGKEATISSATTTGCKKERSKASVLKVKRSAATLVDGEQTDLNKNTKKVIGEQSLIKMKPKVTKSLSLEDKIKAVQVFQVKPKNFMGSNVTTGACFTNTEPHILEDSSDNDDDDMPSQLNDTFTSLSDSEVPTSMDYSKAFNIVPPKQRLAQMGKEMTNSFENAQQMHAALGMLGLASSFPDLQLASNQLFMPRQGAGESDTSLLLPTGESDLSYEYVPSYEAISDSDDCHSPMPQPVDLSKQGPYSQVFSQLGKQRLDAVGKYVKTDQASVVQCYERSLIMSTSHQLVHKNTFPQTHDQSMSLDLSRKPSNNDQRHDMTISKKSTTLSTNVLANQADPVVICSTRVLHPSSSSSKNKNKATVLNVPTVTGSLETVGSRDLLKEGKAEDALNLTLGLSENNLSTKKFDANPSDFSMKGSSCPGTFIDPLDPNIVQITATFARKTEKVEKSANNKSKIDPAIAFSTDGTNDYMFADTSDDENDDGSDIDLFSSSKVSNDDFLTPASLPNLGNRRHEFDRNHVINSSSDEEILKCAFSQQEDVVVISDDSEEEESFQTLTQCVVQRSETKSKTTVVGSDDEDWGSSMDEIDFDSIDADVNIDWNVNKDGEAVVILNDVMTDKTVSPATSKFVEQVKASTSCIDASKKNLSNAFDGNEDYKLVQPNDPAIQSIMKVQPSTSTADDAVIIPSDDSEDEGNATEGHELTQEFCQDLFENEMEDDDDDDGSHSPIFASLESKEVDKPLENSITEDSFELTEISERKKKKKRNKQQIQFEELSSSSESEYDRSPELKINLPKAKVVLKGVNMDTINKNRQAADHQQENIFMQPSSISCGSLLDKKFDKITNKDELPKAKVILNDVFKDRNLSSKSVNVLKNLSVKEVIPDVGTDTSINKKSEVSSPLVHKVNQLRRIETSDSSDFEIVNIEPRPIFPKKLRTVNRKGAPISYSFSKELSETSEKCETSFHEKDSDAEELNEEETCSDKNPVESEHSHSVIILSDSFENTISDNNTFENEMITATEVTSNNSTMDSHKTTHKKDIGTACENTSNSMTKSDNISMSQKISFSTPKPVSSKDRELTAAFIKKLTKLPGIEEIVMKTCKENENFLNSSNELTRAKAKTVEEEKTDETEFTLPDFGADDQLWNTRNSDWVDTDEIGQNTRSNNLCTMPPESELTLSGKSSTSKSKLKLNKRAKSDHTQENKSDCEQEQSQNISTDIDVDQGMQLAIHESLTTTYSEEEEDIQEKYISAFEREQLKKYISADSCSTKSVCPEKIKKSSHNKILSVKSDNCRKKIVEQDHQSSHMEQIHVQNFFSKSKSVSSSVIKFTEPQHLGDKRGNKYLKTGRDRYDSESNGRVRHNSESKDSHKNKLKEVRSDATKSKKLKKSTEKKETSSTIDLDSNNKRYALFEDDDYEEDYGNNKKRKREAPLMKKVMSVNNIIKSKKDKTSSYLNKGRLSPMSLKIRRARLEAVARQTAKKKEESSDSKMLGKSKCSKLLKKLPEIDDTKDKNIKKRNTVENDDFLHASQSVDICPKKRRPEAIEWDQMFQDLPTSNAATFEARPKPVSTSLEEIVSRKAESTLSKELVQKLSFQSENKQQGITMHESSNIDKTSDHFGPSTSAFSALNLKESSKENTKSVVADFLLPYPKYSNSVSDKTAKKRKASPPEDPPHSKVRTNFANKIPERYGTLPPADCKKKVERCLDDFLWKIFQWNALWLQEQEKVGQTPPVVNMQEVFMLLDTYDSYEDYVNIMTPLFLLETWESMYKAWYDGKKESRTIKFPMLPIGWSFSPDKKVMEYTFQGAIQRNGPNQTKTPCEGDLVVLHLQCNPGQAGQSTVIKPVFGYVTSSKRGNVNTFQNIHSRYANADPRQRLTLLELNIKSLHRKLSIAQDVEITVEVVDSIVSQIRQYTALLFLPRSPLARDILRPCNTRVFHCKYNRHNIKPYGDYNSSQSAAIFSVSSAVQEPYAIPKILLLQGPPGTGKSSTIVGIIRRIVNSHTQNKSSPKPRILLCAPSNGGIDELARRLIKERKKAENKIPKEKVINIVRVGNPSSVHQEVQNYCLNELVQKNYKLGQSELMKKRMSSVHSALKDQAAKIDRVQGQIKEYLRHNKKTQAEELQKELQREVRRKRHIEASVSMEKPLTLLEEKKLRKEILQNADIVCCTLNSSGSNKVLDSICAVGQNKDTGSHFTCVIIDEATQTTEIDSLIPLQYGCTKLVLVGDPEQLPATVLSQTAGRRNFSQSLFERLFNFFRLDPHNPVQMLQQQYRMHPQICQFPSQHVYSGKLMTGSDTAKSREKFPLKPYLVFNTTFTQEKVHGSGSTFNPEEANIVAELCANLKCHKKLHDTQIGVVTPYQRQRNVISNILRDKRTDHIEVSTVDGYQGREKDIIVMSCVRAKSNSGSIGFLADRRRMNVALTRARYALYVVGDLESLKVNEDWRSLVQDAEGRQVVINIHSAEEFPAVLQKSIIK